MNKDIYGEIYNGEETYKRIAKHLVSDDYYFNNKHFSTAIIIGWTDRICDHRDIMFTYMPQKVFDNGLQRGMRWANFYVSIIDFTSYGFAIESNTDNRKHNNYLMEKLRLHDNHCDNAICDLINGVIHEIDILEGYVSNE